MKSWTWGVNTKTKNHLSVSSDFSQPQNIINLLYASMFLTNRKFNFNTLFPLHIILYLATKSNEQRSHSWVTAQSFPMHNSIFIPYRTTTITSIVSGRIRPNVTSIVCAIRCPWTRTQCCVQYKTHATTITVARTAKRWCTHTFTSPRKSVSTQASDIKKSISNI